MKWRLAVFVTSLTLTACSSPAFVCSASTCAGCCVEGVCKPGNDPQACGGSGAACAVCAGNGQPNSMAACSSSGVCGVDCATGFHRCGSSCVSNSDVASCGASCTPCAANATCDGKTCGLACPTGTHACGAACASNTDPETCGTSCSPCPNPAGSTARSCDGTTCTFTCPAGQHRCGSLCVSDTSINSCGTGCAPCPFVVNGTSSCNGTTCGVTCSAGFHMCAGACVSNTAASSCGASCTACPAGPANSAPSCVTGACGFACLPGFNLCGGQCVANSASSCGPSCAACPFVTGSTSTCSALGVCTDVCSTGLHKCNGLCVPNTDVNSCGGTACGPCAVPANGTSTCDGVSCSFTCGLGFHKCGALCASNQSLLTCGTTSCTACPTPPVNSTATCDGLTCGVVCSTGFHLCGTQCVSNTALATCGSSCTACPAAPVNATASCNGTTCGFTCNSGFHACAGACVLDSSITACGATCETCAPPANSTAVCSSGSCDFTCTTGLNKCNGACAANSITSCGPSCLTCAAVTNGTPACTGGVCGFTCASGFHACNGFCLPDNSIDSCGASCTTCPDGLPGSQRTCTSPGTGQPFACGAVCQAPNNTCPPSGPTLLCAAPDYTLACGPTCSVCNAPTPNERGVCGVNGICTTDCITRCGGLCVNTQLSAANCGSCGAACAGAEVCSQGACRTACTTGVAFTTMLQTTVLSSTTATLEMTDVDGDGRKDLVALESNSLTVRLAQNIGTAATGTFGPVVFSQFVSGSNRLVAGDLTADGRAELVVLTTGTSATVFRNVGAPTYFTATSFIPSTTVGAALIPSSAVIAEFNNAAPADLVVAFTTTVAGQSSALFVGNGAASGIPITAPGTFGGLGISNLKTLLAAQLTSDTIPDLAAAAGQSTLYVMPGTGSAAAPFNSAAAVLIQLPTTETFSAAPFDLVDATGDLIADLLVPVTGPSIGVRIFPLTVGPVAGTSVLLATPTEVRDLGVEDLNGDGRPDVVVTSSDVRIFLGLAGGGFGPATVLADLSTMSSPTGFRRLVVTNAVGDVRPDLVLLESSAAMVVPNINGGTFPALSGLSLPLADKLAVGDLNADGLTDVVAIPPAASLDAGVQIALRTSGGGWTLGPSIPVGAEFVRIADVNADALSDLITVGPAFTPPVAPPAASNIRQAANGRLEIFLNGAWGTVCDDLFGAPEAMVACRMLGRSAGTYSTVGGGTGSIWLDDLQCNGNESSLLACPYNSVPDCSHSEDVAVTCGPYLTTPIEVRLQAGSGTLGTATRLFPSGIVTALSVADVDNDGKQDIVTTSHNSEIEWFRNLGAGAFAAAARIASTSGYATSMVVVDVNNDGRQDVGVPDDASFNVRFFVNGGTSGFIRQVATTGVGATVQPLAVDVSDDGKVDLLNASGIYTGAGTGVFTLGTTSLSALAARRLLVDLDNDGRLDLAGAAITSNGIGLMRGVATSALFSAPPIGFWAGSPIADVAAARLDTDANRDLVILVGAPGRRMLVSLPGVCR